jgi:virulence factor Mce-like protein
VTKDTPSPLQLGAIVLFSLSCVGMLLFLWLSFSGPLPLRPSGYEFKVALPEATNLVPSAEVRVAGVQVGTVTEVDGDPEGNATLATIELERKFAPIHRDAQFSLRQKSIIGETYVEMTTGTKKAPRLPEEGVLRGPRNVQEVTQVDEILDSFDPYTRGAFQTWQQDLGAGIVNRGLDLNDALGNLPQLVGAGGDLTELLDAQSAALKGVVKNGGVVFDALSRNDRQLRALVENQSTVFSAIQRERQSFADIWEILPTFLVESRLTLRRLQTFARDTDPLVVDLEPVFKRLRPTLIDLRTLSPDLRRLFSNLDPYIDITQRSLPATREITGQLRPTFGALAPLLSEVNPLLQFLSVYQHQVSEFLNYFSSVNAAKGFPSDDPGSTGHVTRLFSPTGPESQALWTRRRPQNRGNAYLPPLSFADPAVGRTGILPSWDCNNAGGDKPATETEPACRSAGKVTFQGVARQFPQLRRVEYLP